MPTQPLKCSRCQRPFASTMAACPFCGQPRAPVAAPAAAQPPPPAAPKREIALPVPPPGRPQPVELHHDPGSGGHMLFRVGLVVLFMGLMGQVFTCMIVRPIPKQEAAEVMKGREQNPVELTHAAADWDSAVVFDPKQPVLVGIDVLSTRPYEVGGRIVQVTGEIESVSIISRVVVYRGPGAGPARRETRIYGALSGSNNRVWAASDPMEVESLDDPRVKTFAALGTYTGLVRRLSNVADIEALRNPTVNGIQIMAEVPDGAVAVVSMSEAALALPASHLAPVIGTDRRLWVVAAQPLAAGTKLAGRYQPWPTKDTGKFGTFTDPPPAGLLFYDASLVDKSRTSWPSLVLLLAGLVCVVLSRRI